MAVGEWQGAGLWWSQVQGLRVGCGVVGSGWLGARGQGWETHCLGVFFTCLSEQILALFLGTQEERV